MRRIALCILFALLAGAAFARGHGHRRDQSNGASGNFDYYVMSLSWSPSFCETHPDEADQCGHKGYGFVLHGLWPQYRSGGWPQHCHVDTEPDEATVERTLAFMPSRHLIEHEWQTHGSCTGLDPQGYFQLADRAFASVQIPPALRAPQSEPQLSANDVVAAFIQANPNLSDTMLSVDCRSGSELSEVRVCLDKDTLAPQACGGRTRNTCRLGNLRIPAVR